MDGVLVFNYVKVISPAQRAVGHDSWHALYAPLRWLYAASPALARYVSVAQGTTAEKRGHVIGNPYIHYYTRVLTGVSCRLAKMLPHVPFLHQLHEAYHAWWLHSSDSTPAAVTARQPFPQRQPVVCNTW